MEILVKKTTEEKVEIKLPYFCKNSCFAFLVLDEERCIKVLHGSKDRPSIEICHAKLPFEVSIESEPCTEHEFQLIYANTLEQLKAILTLPSLPEKQY